MHKKLYRLDSKGKVRIWRIRVDGNVTTTWDGVLDGKLKTTEDVVKEGKNIGKSNATSPAEQALSNAQRKVTLKLRKGYQDTIPTADSIPAFDNGFFNSPPRNFVGPKPLSKMPPELLEAKEAAGDLVYTRKWNGMCVHIVIGADGEPRIFTSQMDEKTDFFPWQVEEIKTLGLPNCSWFMAEGVSLLFHDGENYDCPDRMKTVFGHSVDKSLAWQEENDYTDFEIFNVLFWNGEQLDNTWQERMDVLRTYIDVDEYGHQHIHVVWPEVFTHKDAMEVLQECPHYEGYVIWDTKHTNMPIKWGGAPSRKAGCWKLKNFKEADVLIYKWETGKGKLNNDVATLSYGAYDKDGEIIHMGRGGSGLDAKLRAEIQGATLPLVCELKYEEITKAGKFRLPVILRVRDDKPAIECTVESIVK